MTHQMVSTFWVLVAVSSIFLCTSFLQPVPLVQAQTANWTYSTNADDYDFGWLANGTWSAGSEPYCTYCINALSYDPLYTPTNADLARGYYWNRTVGTYRCDGVQPNEFWAFHEQTQTIVFGNLTEGNVSQVLCLDAVAYTSLGFLKLRPCNSSAVSQQWTKSGTRVVSTLLSQAGQEEFLIGSVPNPSTSATNQNYEFVASVGSSLPNPLPGYTYVDEFTFLSRKSLVDPSTIPYTLTTKGLLEINNNALGILWNGGFERSTIQAGSDISWSDYSLAQPSYFALCGWVIELGPIDYVKAGLLLPAEGSYSVHLNTQAKANYSGQISQTTRTEAGSDYLLTFSFNGFPPHLITRNCSSNYTTALLQVRITNSTSSGGSSGGGQLQSDGYGLQQNFSIDVTSSNIQTFPALWQSHELRFKASTNVTNVTFRSLNIDAACGPMVDAVSLGRIKPKSFWDKTASQVAVGVAAGFVLLAFILLGVYCARRRYCPPEEDYSGLYKTENARVFSVKELSASTNKFSAVVGEGAFGTVYKAEFPDGTTGAVKVEKHKGIHLRSSKILASDEINVLLRVHHRNLVNLTGFCIHRGRHMLVFEYLPNGSLHDRLHQSVIPTPIGDSLDSIELRRLYEHVLPWHKRTKIASDVAYGLEYLHHDADPPIVHRDVKSRNILLTATDSAKLADFGLSKAAPADATAFQSIETMVRGSIGYLDPQYFLTGVFSAKSDVYSYGVVLLELISGHQAIYNAASLSSWAAPYMTSPSLYHELVDKKLKGKYEKDELESLVELTRMCMQDDSKMRPNMRQVVAFLNARHLVVAGGESSEAISSSETISREAYHKMHPVFIDFESVSTQSAGSRDSVFVSPRPRD